MSLSGRRAKVLGVMKRGGLGKRPRFPRQSSRCWRGMIEDWRNGETPKQGDLSTDVGQKQKKAEEKNSSKARKRSKFLGKK